MSQTAALEQTIDDLVFNIRNRKKSLPPFGVNGDRDKNELSFVAGKIEKWNSISVQTFSSDTAHEVLTCESVADFVSQDHEEDGAFAYDKRILLVVLYGSIKVNQLDSVSPVLCANETHVIDPGMHFVVKPIGTCKFLMVCDRR